ncbi:hypothetical protein [Salegentibacter chungangensis]|uniref:Co-chaperone DjlA N-terminal domain-containing protein n=1 Tax=Salegentibacter chungangensis TaxID=1335724 RepID=A0ABW3NUT1_9FLAO
MKKLPSTYAAEKFYENLGKLFYAIAAADKVVREQEVKSLKKIVKTKWLGLEGSMDEFGTDEAYQMEVMLDWLEDNRPDANEAFNEFKDYKMEHEQLFDQEVNKLIWKTADAIASSFAGKNKSELIMLSKLKSILQT